jgi:hypothetical protein
MPASARTASACRADASNCSASLVVRSMSCVASRSTCSQDVQLSRWALASRPGLRTRAGVVRRSRSVSVRSADPPPEWRPG